MPAPFALTPAQPPAATPTPTPAPKKSWRDKNWGAFAAAIILTAGAVYMSTNDKDVKLAQIAAAGKGPIPAIPAANSSASIPAYGERIKETNNSPTEEKVDKEINVTGTDFKYDYPKAGQKFRFNATDGDQNYCLPNGYVLEGAEKMATTCPDKNAPNLFLLRKGTHGIMSMK